MKRIACFFALVLAACHLPVSAPAAEAPAAPSSFPSPTLAATPTPTPTLAPTFTPTPDLRIINLPAQNFKLTLNDLPRGYTIVFVPLCGDVYDPQCGLASDRIEGPNLNYEILQEYGAEKGGRYINATGRVEGWYVYYYYRYSYEEYPRVILSNVIRFASVEGAREYMRNYANALSSVRYTEVFGYPQTGDASRAFIRQFYGDKYLVYEFAYRNFVHRIWFEGTEENIAPNLIQDLSFRALLKLQAAQLSDPPQILSPATLTPAPDSPSPDARVILSQPSELTLARADLPPEANYRLNGKQSGPYTNAEFINAHPGFGTFYVNKTKRLGGWDVSYQRGANDLLLPVRLRDSVTLFESAEGARLHVTDYASIFLGDGWAEQARAPTIGDVSRAFVKETSVYREYRAVFAYCNVVHELTAEGLQAEVSPAWMEALAFRLLVRLQSAAFLK